MENLCHLAAQLKHQIHLSIPGSTGIAFEFSIGSYLPSVAVAFTSQPIVITAIEATANFRSEIVISSIKIEG